jgi:two-component system response regulator ChvI
VQRIAVVDDEASLRETLALAIGREGYEVELHADGLAAWTAFERRLPALVVLDILMPRLDGLELLRRLRARSAWLPILMLTSKAEEVDRVLGLELGADDYLVKPFSVRELVARIRVLLRRAALLAEGGATAPDRKLERGRLTLDLDRHQASLDGRLVPLTVSEFLLLAALARRPGHVRSRVQLLDDVHGDDDAGMERTIDSHVKRLRRKLQGLEPGFDPVEAVYGAGYRFREPA